MQQQQQQQRTEGQIAVGAQQLSVKPSNEDLIAIIQPQAESQLPSIFYQDSAIQHGYSSSQIGNDDKATTDTKPAVTKEPINGVNPPELLREKSSQQTQITKTVTIQPDPVTLPREQRRLGEYQSNPLLAQGLATAKEQRSINSSRARKPVRRQRLINLLKQVELLQLNIAKLPSQKDRHYVQPYIRLGQASNLNLNAPTGQIAEQIEGNETAKRKSEIQHAAQLLLKQFEHDKPKNKSILAGQRSNEPAQQSRDTAAVDDSQTNQFDSQFSGKMQRLPTTQTQQRQGTEPAEIQSFNYIDEMQKNATDNAAAQDSATFESSVRCLDCGHVATFTATDRSSVAPANQSEFNREMLRPSMQPSEKPKQMKSLSPTILSADQTWPRSGILIQKGLRNSERITPISRHASNAYQSSSIGPKKESPLAAKTGTASRSNEAPSKCKKCGSRNLVPISNKQKNRTYKAQADKPMRVPRPTRKKISQNISENTVHKTKTFNKRPRHPYKDESIISGKRSPVSVRKSPVGDRKSPLGDRQSPVGDRKSPVGGRKSPVVGRKSPVSGRKSPVSGRKSLPLGIKHIRQRLGMQQESDQQNLDYTLMVEKRTDESLSQNRSGSKGKQHSTMTLPHEVQQINLQIRKRNDGGLQVGPGSTDNSQGHKKMIQITKKQEKPAKTGRSPKRATSGKKKNRKSVRLPNGSIICGKCATQHKKHSKCTKRKSMQIKEGDDFTLETHDNDLRPDLDLDPSLTELNPTRRAESDNMKSLAILRKFDDEISSHGTMTNMVSDCSRKIRDSIEFTSQTCSARQQVNFEEMSEAEQDMISDALMSELRAIADGNFELCGEPVALSIDGSQNSKSNRINLLSLGALTAHNYENPGLDAQSNIATNQDLPCLEKPLKILHSEHGSKVFLSNARGEANQRASGAFGSEFQYSNSNFYQAGAYPLRQMIEADDEEDEEESFEEELESGMYSSDYYAKSCVSLQNSNATSYSDWYIIDEKEEARLKQIAFEKYLAEQAIEQQIQQAQRGVVQYPKQTSPQSEGRFNLEDPKSLSPPLQRKQNSQDPIKISGKKSSLLQKSKEQTPKKKKKKGSSPKRDQKKSSSPKRERKMAFSPKRKTSSPKRESKQSFIKPSGFQQQDAETEPIADRILVDSVVMKRQESKESSIELQDRSVQCSQRASNINYGDVALLTRNQKLSMTPLDTFSHDYHLRHDPSKQVPCSSHFRSGVFHSDNDKSELIVSHDEKSFQTGIQTQKAYRPEALYEESPCINIMKSMEKSRQMDINGQPLKDDSNSNQFETMQLLTQNQSLMNKDYHPEVMKVKFTTQNTGQIRGQSQINHTKSMITDFHGPHQPKLNSMTPLQSQLLHCSQDASYLQWNGQCQQQLESRTQYEAQLQSGEIEIKPGSQQQEIATSSTQKAGTNQEGCSFAQGYEVVASKHDLFVHKHSTGENHLIDSDQQLKQNFEAKPKSQKPDSTILSNSKSNVNRKDTEQDQNAPTSSLQNLILQSRVASAIVYDNANNIESRQKHYSDKFQQFPTSSGNITMDMKSPNSMPDIASRTSYKRKKTSQRVEMVDRSQQDSRCGDLDYQDQVCEKQVIQAKDELDTANQGLQNQNQEEKVGSQLPDADHTHEAKQNAEMDQTGHDKDSHIQNQQNLNKSSDSAVHKSIQQSNGRSPSIVPQASSNQANEDGKQLGSDSQQVQWVIVMGQRRPLTSSKPRAGSQARLSGVSVDCSEVKFLDMEPQNSSQLPLQNQGDETEIQQESVAAEERNNLYTQAIVDEKKEAKQVATIHSQKQQSLSPSRKQQSLSSSRKQQSLSPRKETVGEYDNRMMKESGMEKLSDNEASPEVIDQSNFIQNMNLSTVPEQTKRLSIQSRENKKAIDVTRKFCEDTIAQNSDTARTIEKQNSLVNERSTIPQSKRDSRDGLSNQKARQYQVKMENSYRDNSGLKTSSIVDIPIETEKPKSMHQQRRATRNQFKSTERTKQSQQFTSAGKQSPNAFRINPHTQVNQMRSRGINLSATSEAQAMSIGRRLKANQVAYFNNQGNPNQRLSKMNFPSTANFSQSQANVQEQSVLSVSPIQNASRNAVAAVSTNSQGQKIMRASKNAGNYHPQQPQYLYEVSVSPKSNSAMPRYMIQNDKNSSAWNAKTEKNMQEYLKKRSSQQLKDIQQEVEEVKPMLLFEQQTAANSQQQSQIVESGYGTTGVRSLNQTNTSGKVIQYLQSQASTNPTGINEEKYDEMSAEDLTQIEPPRVQHQIDCLSQDGSVIEGNPPILISSGSLDQQPAYAVLDPALQKYAKSGPRRSETGGRLRTQERQPYNTLSKGEQQFVQQLNQSAHNYSSDWQIDQAPQRVHMSNFSTQYRLFRSQRKGTASERRNIYASTTNKRSPVICDMYFQGQVAQDQKSQQGTPKVDTTSIKVVPQDLGRRYLRSSLVDHSNGALDTPKADEKLRLSQAIKNTTMYSVNENFGSGLCPSVQHLVPIGPQQVDIETSVQLDKRHQYPNYQRLQCSRGHSGGSSSGTKMISRLKNSYQNQLNMAPGNKQRQICGNGRQSSSPLRNQKRLQFYPQTVAKKGPMPTSSSIRSGGGIRLNPHLQQPIGKHQGSIGGYVEFNLIHDNQHAPFLGSKYLKTTAFL